MEKLNIPPQSTTSPRRPRTRWGYFIGAPAIAALLLAGAAYTHRVIPEARAVLGAMPTIERDYQLHQVPALVLDMAQVQPEAARLTRDLAWTQSLYGLPVIGHRIHALDAMVQALAASSYAATLLKPVTAVSPFVLSRKSIAHLHTSAVLASARAVIAVDAVPARFPGSTSGERSAVKSLKSHLTPLVGLARLALKHPQGIRWIFDPAHTERFLVLFQDSGELRSTGGFLAAYGYLTIHQGRVSLKFEPNISSLSQKVQLKVPPVWVLSQYFHARHTALINANLNPNVPASALAIERLYNSVPHHPPINGVVFTDSWLADQVLAAMGPVTTDGITFTSQNLNRTMEYMAEHRDLPGSSRMLFLGQILQQLSTRFWSLPQDNRQALSLITSALRRKHLIFYANNPGLERWLTSRSWSGTIPKLAGQNSLMVVNDNYGGLKDNYYLSTHLLIGLKKLPNGRYEERVTTRWTMTGIRNGWMVGTYVGWVQCYLPRGTKLLSLTGYHVHGIRASRISNLDRTSFGTGILIAPRSNAAAPPNIRTLTWVFLLPRMRNPSRIHLIIQPGLPDQGVSYPSHSGPINTVERQNRTITVTPSPT